MKTLKQLFILMLLFAPWLMGCSTHQRTYCGEYAADDVKTPKPHVSG